MIIRTFYGFVLAAVLSFIFASLAASNGRSIGVRWEHTPLKATYEDAKGTESSLARVKVKKGDKTVPELEIRIGETLTTVPMAKIRRIDFKKAEADQAGFVPAELVLYDGMKETLEVKVIEAGKPILLVGYTKFGLSEVALVKCRWIKFEVFGAEKNLPREMEEGAEH